MTPVGVLQHSQKGIYGVRKVSEVCHCGRCQKKKAAAIKQRPCLFELVDCNAVDQESVLELGVISVAGGAETSELDSPGSIIKLATRHDVGATLSRKSRYESRRRISPTPAR
jgi:hypothetical protein